MNEHCPEHEKLVEVIHNIDKTTTELSVRINGALDKVASHIEQGVKWRTVILCIAATLILNIIVAVFWSGQMMRQVEINTKRLDRAEASFFQDGK